MVYKFNENVPAMKIYDRTMYLLQDAGIKISHNEYLAIRNQEGLFDESNKFYFTVVKRKPNLEATSHY
jgi:hypothetical protein